MGLKGDLSTFSLAEVFQMIATARKEGTLVVDDGESRKVIYFSNAGVKLLSSGTRKYLPLGELLIKAGLLTSIQLKEALARQKRSGRKLGEILCDLEIVKQEHIDQAVRQQIEEEIYDLFTWPQANFEFIEGDLPEEFKEKEHQITSLHFNVNSLIFEAVRRLDEWRLINETIPNHQVIIALTAKGVQFKSDEQLDSETKAIVQLVNNERTINQIINDSSSSRFNAAKIIYGLVKNSAVREITTEEIKNLAEQAQRSGQTEKALLLYQQFLKLKPMDLAASQNVAGLLEAMNRTAEAAQQYKQVADILAQKEKWDEAAAAYQKVIQYTGDNLEAHQALFGLLMKLTPSAKAATAKSAAGQPPTPKADPVQTVAAGKDFLKLLLQKKQTNLALEVARQLVSFAPRDFELQTYIAMVYYEAGEYKNSRKIISQALGKISSSKIKELIETYREILKNEPHQADVRYRLNLLSNELTGRRKRQKLLIGVTSILLLGGILVLLFYLTYEFPARQELELIQPQVKKLEAMGQYKLALEKYQEFRHPWAFLTNPIVEKEKKRLIGYVQGMESEKMKLITDDLAKLTKLFDAAAEAEKKDDYFREALTLYQNLLAEVDKRFESEQTNAHFYREFQGQIKNRINTLTKYLTDARNLSAKAAQHDQAGQIDEARRLIMELVKNYPRTKESREAKLPLKITSTPSPADVYFNNLKQGETPLKIYMMPNSSVTVRVSKKGFASAQQEINSYEHTGFHFNLDKTTKWIYAADGLLEGLTVGEGILYAAGRDGSLYAVNVLTGQPQWRFRTEAGSDISTAPLLRSPLVYFGCDDGYFYAVRINTGQKVWSVKLGGRLKAAPVLSPDGQTVYIGADNKYLYALNSANGETRWSFLTAGKVFLNCAVAGNAVYVISDNRTIHSVNARNGQEEWQLKLEQQPTAPPCLVNNTLYLADADQYIYALNLLDRKVKWRYKTKGGIRTVPVYANGKILVGSDDGVLSVLEAVQGNLEWQFKTAAAVQSPPVVSSDNFVYVGSNDNYFYALPLTGGNPVWKYQMGHKSYAAPVIYKDMVFASAADRKIYAFER